MHVYSKYIHVFVCICTYFSKCFPAPAASAHLLAPIRWRCCAWSLQLACAHARGRCAGSAGANNQQIYLDWAAAAAGNLNSSDSASRWRALALWLASGLPWGDRETISMSKIIISVDRFDGHCWESDLGFFDPPTHRNQSTEKQRKRLRRNWNNLKNAKHSIPMGLKVKMWNR